MDQSNLSRKIAEVAMEVARVTAEDVDRKGRFPSETIGALREAGAFGAGVPRELGGAGATVGELGAICETVARQCASSGMILAMHHIQVLALAHFRAKHHELDSYLAKVASEGRLIASVTSEVGISGDLRSSICAVHVAADRYTLTKKATTISYGAYADDLLITSRRNDEASSSDQVMVLALRGEYDLQEPGEWDTLGMRGTCSAGATVNARGQAWQVVTTPFGEVAARSMVPTSHILWASCWLGLAHEAVSRAQTSVRAKGRATPQTPPKAAAQLSQLIATFHLMRDGVRSITREYDELLAAENYAHLASLGYAIRINNLKLMASTKVLEICNHALSICGIRGYKNNDPLSIGRLLRDAHSAELMINNDRLHETNASLLLVHKGL